jgi:Ca2+-transporting ATPase
MHSLVITSKGKAKFITYAKIFTASVTIFILRKAKKVITFAVSVHPLIGHGHIPLFRYFMADSHPFEKNKTALQGLTTEQAEQKRVLFGRNQLEDTRPNAFWTHLKDLVTEPMFILLFVACLIYFILGEWTEAIMMLVAILFVAGIEIYQENKSEKALETLRAYTRAKVKVLRDGQWVFLDGSELVPGDVVSIEEGERVPADGRILDQNDLRIDESVLTGESVAVEKNAFPGEQNQVFQGTMVAGGKGIVEVQATGAATELGKLGKTVAEVESEQTPLQKQIRHFVRQMGVAGGIAFLITFVVNYLLQGEVLTALLFSLTLAMAILPEEIPVAFSAFMALGAFRMIKHGILAKDPKTVESLGSATVLCLDKTGTITENRMSVAEIRDIDGDGRLLEYALLASEPEPFDAMEKAIEKHFFEKHREDPRVYQRLVKEYNLSGVPPAMTHIWQDTNGQQTVVCKGAVERIVQMTRLDKDSAHAVLEMTDTLADSGYRVLGVAKADFDGPDFPGEQDAFAWSMKGLVAFYDPPKGNALEAFQQFYGAGIRIIMITGDHKSTAHNIARQTGIRGTERILTGADVMSMDADALRESVQGVNLFARMFPDAKLRVVEALKANGEVVAMSGDGVNDGPALKSAHIGVAMGKKGTDMAKNAASLVLMDDNLSSMVTALRTGRRIYDNLRKAIRYVISIHLPIVAVVLLPLLLGWPYPHILLPLHVIFLELVMDPTAAVAFENEPEEQNILHKPPRSGGTSLFSGRELGFSLLQGAVIAAGVLAMYQYALQQGHAETTVRSVVFATMVFANLGLTLTNRSFDYALHHTLRTHNRILPVILLVSLLLLLVTLYVPFAAGLFSMAPLSLSMLAKCLATGLLSTWWFEVYKLVRNG